MNANMLTLQGTILTLILVGYAISKIGIMPAPARAGLTDLVIYLVLPCNILTAFLVEFNMDILKNCFVILLVSLGIQFCMSLLGRFAYPGRTPDEKIVLRYATLVSNAGFLGNPVVESIYGVQALVYASMYLIPQRIIMWSAGLSLFEATDGKTVLKKSLTHPCIVSAVLGLILMVTQLPLPAVLTTSLRYIGNCNTALSMIVIGGILSEVDPRSVVNGKVLYYCLLRLIVIPLAVLGCCKLLALDGMVTGISAVLAGMPAAATTAVLAAKYNRAEHFAVSLVFLSTALSIFTIPVIYWLTTLI